MQRDPKVSVIIPVYNSEQYISKCLDSILNQTYLNTEIILIDDGSSDRSKDIINRYLERDERIRYFYQHNTGPSEARNNGILKSTGKYLVFVDSDDTVEMHYIEYLLKEMIESDSDLVCCGYTEISKYGALNCIDFDFNCTKSLQLFIEKVCEGTGGVLWGKIYKKQIITDYNLKLDKDLFMSEDLVFVLQYLLHCRSFSVIDKYLYRYNRLNLTSISSNISMNYIQNNISVCKFIEKTLKALNTEGQKTNKLITRRVQDMVIILMEQQSSNIKEIGMSNAVDNVRQILSVQYLRNYRSGFIADKFYYRPYIFFIKNNFYKSILMYGIYLNVLRKLKNIFN